jgi:molecular chaperone DnaK
VAILGLDFGTTNTVACWLDGDEPRFVPMADGVYTLPSVVCFHEKGAPPLVGESARQMLSEKPETTVHGPKRFIGRRYASDFVGRYHGRFLFPIVEGPGGMAATQIFGEVMSFEEVSRFIIERVLELAAAAAGQAFRDVVVSFPAHFHHRQRRSLRKVIERAGLRVRRMITEPTAAAVAAFDDQWGRDAMVFDLGGGTFDATVIHTETGVVEVRGTGGDVFLGGFEFDEKVTDALLDQFLEDKNIDLREDGVVHQRVLLASEAAKMLLSEHDCARVRVPCAQITEEGFEDLEYYVDRADLEYITDPLLERAVGIANKVMQAAGMYASELTDVVLVGGQTQMPRIRQRVEEVFGLEPKTNVHPSLGVALGAARVAGGFGALRDAVSVPIYAMTPGRGPRVLFGKNCPVPDDNVVELPPAPPGDVPVVIYEAVDATAIDRDVLGKVVVPRDWLLQHAPAQLRIQLNKSFSLTFEAEGEGGAKLPLILEDPTAKPKPKPIEIAAPPLNREGEVDAVFGCELEFGGNKSVVRTRRIGPLTIEVDIDDPPSPGTRVTLSLAVQPNPISVDAVVHEAMAAFGAARSGRPPGFVAKVEANPGSPYVRLVEALRVTGGMGEETGRALVNPNVGERVPRAVRRFVTRVRDNDLYGALKMSPIDGQAVLEAKVEALMREITERMQVATPEIKKQLMGASRLVERVTNALRDPRRRLAYDFKHGYELIDTRLRRAGQEAIFDLDLLRSAWRHAHPADIDEAQRCRARAASAEANGEVEATRMWLKLALDKDPFDAETRKRLEKISKVS